MSMSTRSSSFSKVMLWRFMVLDHVTHHSITITFGTFAGPASYEREETSGNLVLEVNTEEQPMPLALMILIPILSFGLILVILTVVCIRRSSTAASTASSLTASPLVKTSVDASQNTSVDHPYPASNTTLQTLKRLSSLHHFYAKPWAMSYITSAANNEATRPPPHQVATDGMHDQDEDDDESW